MDMPTEVRLAKLEERVSALENLASTAIGKLVNNPHITKLLKVMGVSLP
jgi:hypothetical protein